MVALLFEISKWLGLSVLVLAALAVLAVVVLMVLRYWPIGLCRITETRRRYKHGGTPRIDWRAESGAFTPVTALMGLTSRHKTRWFFGLMMMRGNEYDPALAESRIIQKKPEATS